MHAVPVAQTSVCAHFPQFDPSMARIGDISVLYTRTG